ncbi:hypothetical protein MKO06_15665 [Gramella sp. GC03-9]|uniref:Lipoprotein n=1 Tax=Christiangramia oceanisediminis TaxID=2920386 RepID=A0A9X2KZT1_9FLAO|nr:hypothetical protein [Gramella oceanisediminis]MCP9201347.1 hypothetical protein [Gramella oceanisediminis]
MKRILSYLAICAFLISCTNESIPEEEIIVANSQFTSFNLNYVMNYSPTRECSPDGTLPATNDVQIAFDKTMPQDAIFNFAVQQKSSSGNYWLDVISEFQNVRMPAGTNYITLFTSCQLKYLHDCFTGSYGTEEFRIVLESAEFVEDGTLSVTPGPGMNGNNYYSVNSYVPCGNGQPAISLGSKWTVGYDSAYED